MTPISSSSLYETVLPATSPGESKDDIEQLSLTVPWTDLPFETFSHIFSLLEDAPDVVFECRKVCKLWNAVICSNLDTAWNQLKQNPPKGHTAWKERMTFVEEWFKFKGVNYNSVDLFNTLNKEIEYFYTKQKTGPLFSEIHRNQAEAHVLASSLDLSLVSMWLAITRQTRVVNLTPQEADQDLVNWYKNVANSARWLREKFEDPAFSASLGTITGLEFCNHHTVTMVVPEIRKLIGLQVLHLTNNHLIELTDSIGKLTALQVLELSFNQLTKLPDDIGNLSSLQRLDILSNQLTELPDDIGKLTALRNLRLTNNKLTELPDSIGELTALDELVLYRNQLTELPNSIGNLTMLRTLQSYANRLTALPDSIGNLTALTGLFLGRNKLTDLPDTIAKLTRLEQLYLEYNQLTVLPNCIGNLTALQRLYLDYNQLTKLPDDIGKLSALKRLILNNNELTALPDDISNLTGLEELWLHNNALTALPDSIDRLTGLKRLRLENNQLTAIPDAVRNLPGLQIDLAGNPVEEDHPCGT